MIGRREFITLIGGATAWPLAAGAQQLKQMPQVGVLIPTGEDDSEYRLRLNTFLHSFQKSGWVQDRNFALAVRYGHNRRDQMERAAAALVALKTNVILTAGTEAVQAAQKATQSIPIVMATIGDPVGVG